MDNDFLERWVNQDEHVQVALLSAPGTFPPVPSIALSIFQAALDGAGISSKVVYSSFPMTYLLGMDAIEAIMQRLDLLKDAEYLFAHLTDVSASVPVDVFVRECAPKAVWNGEEEELAALLTQAMDVAEQVVEASAQRIVRMGARVVAATSVYSQQCATLAILKRVKELDPSVATIVGGYNVTDAMGLNVLRHFPSVDYVCFGEGDELIVELVERLLAHGDEPLPYGILGRSDPLPKIAPYRMTKDMNSAPTPDYRDFFEEIQREDSGFYGKAAEYRVASYESTVFLEGSRGCWWGAKRPCSFCGLNGLTNVYREKTPERLYQEILEMTRLYPGVNIQLSDNVLSQRMIQELLPMLVENPQDHSIFCEIKTNLRWREVRSLARAGVKITQPGIESLNDHLLKLMGKGGSAVQNIALMKYHKACRVYPVWNMMTGVPGEEREDYEQMLELMPLLVHLQPPTRANPIVFMRFSRYCEHPQEHGLELQTDPLYRCCFAGHEDIADNMGGYYVLSGGSFVDTRRENRDLYGRIQAAVFEWRKLFYSKEPPSLVMTESFLGLVILDTRPCALESRRILVGLSAEIYRLAWEPVTLKSLLKQLPEHDEDSVRAACENLVRDRLMLCMSGRYLALAVPKNNLAAPPSGALR